jgi:Acyl-coenzyme A:6-aminopenicillanic acid acyl-transferase
MTGLLFFKVSGDSHAIGVGLGRQAQHGIRDILPTIGRFQTLESDWAGSDYLAQLEAAARRSFPLLVREIEGIASGSEVDFAKVFLWNCRGDLPEKEIGEAAGCTTIMFPGADVGQPNVIGHNEDGDAEEDGACFLVSVEPDDGPAFTSFYNPGLIPGHTFAFNQAGLVQTINHISPGDRRPGIPRHIITRAVLGCASLDGAVDLLTRKDRASGFHHNLGQVGDDRLLSVEAPASGCSVKTVTVPHCHANHLVHPDLKENLQVIGQSSALRQERGDQLLESASDNDPRPILLDRDTKPLPIYRKSVGDVDTGFTLATGIFEIGKTDLSWRVYHQLDEAPAHEGVFGIKSRS